MDTEVHESRSGDEGNQSRLESPLMVNQVGDEQGHGDEHEALMVGDAEAKGHGCPSETTAPHKQE